MADRTILITGCSTGIGKCCALTMKRRDWQVIATARNEQDLEMLRSEGLDAVFLDYTDADSIASASQYALEKCDGNLTALYNNGAYGQPGAVEDIETNVLRQQFETNFFGWHDLTRRLLPHMRRQKSGRIVNCSSVLGLVAMKYRGAYCASKFALEALTDCLRLELRGTDIHVSLIEPGPIRSQFVETARNALLKHVDIGNSVHSEDYQMRLKQFEEGGTTRFKLEPEAVAQKLIHAVESPRPRARYFVTKPTYAMDILKRLLPDRALDFVLSKG